MKTEYRVHVIDIDETIDDAIVFESEWTPDCEFIAGDAAQCLWENCDGWDWMGGGVDEIVISSIDGDEIGRFEIFIESVPSFSAVKKD